MSKFTVSTAAGRRVYIVQAALEYLVALLVGGSFLATLTKELGFSDSLTGILSSVISLGCVFQLGTVFLRPRRVKPLVVTLSIVNQLLFASLYILPLLGVDRQWRIVAAIAVIVVAYLTYYIVHPGKLNWLMSLVEDGHRGTFTANKEIVSLLAGTLFTFLMGAVCDYFIEQGNITVAFVVSAAVLGLLTVLHTICLIITPEPKRPAVNTANVAARFGEVLRDKRLLRVSAVFMLYYVAYGSTIPFYGAYLVGDLGLSLTVVSVLTLVSSVSRIALSNVWGRYADRRSFAASMEKSLWVLVGAYLCAACAVPSNGVVMFAGYYLLHGIAMGGVNSALTNMVFDYVPFDRRADSLAVCQALSGVVGFVTTLCVSPLVSTIQAGGNRVLGLPLYAPQLLSVLGVVVTLLVILLVRRTLIKVKSEQP